MANELEVKEITELNDVSFSDESLVLAYTENEGVGRATFAKAKEAIGADIDIEQTKTGTAPSAENELTATIRNGKTTVTKTFTIKNGTGLSAATQTESTDANGLRSNAVTLKSSDTTLVQDVSFTVKDGVGIKSHNQTETTDADGLRKNTLAVTYTDGKKDSITVKDGVGIKSHSLEKTTDANGLSKTTLNVAYTDGKTDTAAISDGVGIKSASQTKASTLSGELNEYTVRLTDGTESKINVYNGRAGKDFRIKKTYTSIAAMNADFSGTDVETYEFAMIDTGSVEDADTGKLYCKGETEWKYIGDLSGAQGIKGDTGNGIASVENSLTEEGKIKIVIKMTDGTSNEFLINNGLQYTAGNNVKISASNEISVDLSGKADKQKLDDLSNTLSKKITDVENNITNIKVDADHFEGTLPINKGGTGGTTGQAAFDNIAAGVRTSTSPVDEETMLVHSTSWYKTTVASFWEYIKEKISSVLGLTAHIYNGKVVKYAGSSMWVYGRDQAIVRNTSPGVSDAWTTIFSQKTADGSVEFGNLAGQNYPRLVYTRDSDYNSGNNQVYHIIGIDPTVPRTYVLGALNIPTSAPSSPTNGDIWIE